MPQNRQMSTHQHALTWILPQSMQHLQDMCITVPHPCLRAAVASSGPASFKLRQSNLQRKWLKFPWCTVPNSLHNTRQTPLGHLSKPQNVRCTKGDFKAFAASCDCASVFGTNVNVASSLQQQGRLLPIAFMSLQVGPQYLSCNGMLSDILEPEVRLQEAFAG